MAYLPWIPVTHRKPAKQVGLGARDHTEAPPECHWGVILLQAPNGSVQVPVRSCSLHLSNGQPVLRAPFSVLIWQEFCENHCLSGVLCSRPHRTVISPSRGFTGREACGGRPGLPCPAWLPCVVALAPTCHSAKVCSSLACSSSVFIISSRRCSMSSSSFNCGAPKPWNVGVSGPPACHTSKQCPLKLHPP